MGLKTAPEKKNTKKPDFYDGKYRKLIDEELIVQYTYLIRREHLGFDVLVP